MADTGDRHTLVELLDDLPIAMFTTYGGSGIRSVPMARQETEPDAEMWFIADRTRGTWPTSGPSRGSR